LFALQFHFDWMLLPRDQWQKEIAEAAEKEDEKEIMTRAAEDFFLSTPKVTDERERVSLRDFIKRYWTFDGFPKVDAVAETALKLIMDKPEALMKTGNMKDFLKMYDECRYKFIEMSKVTVE
ncbi:MAG: hypothetical protein ACI4UA_00655, partial [Bacteroidaceae bacterium]